MTWNDVPDDMEQYSSLYGTGVPLIKNPVNKLIMHCKWKCCTVR